MRFARSLIAAFLVVVTAPCLAALQFEGTDFEVTYPFSTVRSELTLSNPDTTAIQIISLTARDPKQARVLKQVDSLAPGATLVIPVEFDVGNRVGNSFMYFDVEYRSAEAATPNTLSTAIRGFVDTILDQAQPRVELGVVDLPERPWHEIELSSREVADFRIERVLESPPFVETEIGANGRVLRVRAIADAPWGLQVGNVRLALNAAQHSEAWVVVAANVHGRVLPNLNPLSFDLARQGTVNERRVRIEDRTGKRLKIGTIKASGAALSVAAEPCVPKRKSCTELRVRLEESQARGQILGRIDVELPKYKRVLPIVVAGILIGKDTKILDLNEEIERQAKEAAASAPTAPETASLPPGSPLTTTPASSGALASNDIAAALQQAVKPEIAMGLPSGIGPLIRWKIANEQALFGYNIYRADAEAGPFLRVNPTIVRTMSEDGSGASYAWRDNAAISGRTYWYYVGSVGTNGEKKALSGPQRAVAK